MIKSQFLLFFVVIGLFSCVNLSYESYAGQNVEELIKKFGDTYLDEYKTIPKYISGYEIEPDFTLYFSKEELDNELSSDMSFGNFLLRLFKFGQNMKMMSGLFLIRLNMENVLGFRDERKY